MTGYAWAPPKLKTVERFFTYVKKSPEPDGCWNWTGARSRGKGNKAWYTSFWVSGRTVVRAHIFVCVVEGRMKPGETVDHSCKNTLCVNPDHLEVVTRTENSLRRWRDTPRKAA